MTFLKHTHCLYMYCIAKYTYWRQENLQMGSSVCGGVWVWGGCGGVGVCVGGGGVRVCVCIIIMFPTYPQYNSSDITTSAHTHNI